MADYSYLKQRAQEVRNETKAGANTADRVGYVLEETVKAVEAEEQRARQAETTLQSSVQNRLQLYHENGTEAASIGTHDRIQLNGTTADGEKIVDFYISAKELYALLRVASTSGDYATSIVIENRTITLTAPDSVALGTRTLNLGDVGSISGAVFAGLRANDNINIKGKTTIAHNIDPGELKVLHSGSNKGLILRTVEDPNNPNGLKLVELLSTDGYSSYKYTFPAQSGGVAMASDLSEKADIGALESKQDKLVRYSEGNNVLGESLAKIIADRVVLSGEKNSANTLSCTSDGIYAVYNGDDAYDALELDDEGVSLLTRAEGTNYTAIRLRPDGNIELTGTVSIKGQHEVSDVGKAFADMRLTHYEETEEGARLTAPGRVSLGSGVEKAVVIVMEGGDTDAILLGTNGLKARIELKGGNAQVTADAVQLTGTVSIDGQYKVGDVGKAIIDLQSQGQGQTQSLKHYTETENEAAIAAPSRVTISGEQISLQYKTNGTTGLTVSEEYVSVASTDGANGAVVAIEDNSAIMQAYDASGNSSTLTLSPDGAANLEAKSMRIYSIDRAVGSAEINVSPAGVSIAGASLNLASVPKIENARFLGLQTDGDINIKGKTRISHNIDSGELKVLHNIGNDGFILRTVSDPTNPQGLKLVELLSTDGYSSYKYVFPNKSGQVALKSEIPDISGKQNKLAHYLETIVSLNGTAQSYATITADAVQLRNAQTSTIGVTVKNDRVESQYVDDQNLAQVTLNSFGVTLQSSGLEADSQSSINVSPSGNTQISASGEVDIAGEVVKIHPANNSATGLHVLEEGVSISRVAGYTQAQVGVENNSAFMLTSNEANEYTSIMLNSDGNITIEAKNLTLPDSVNVKFGSQSIEQIVEAILSKRGL